MKDTTVFYDKEGKGCMLDDLEYNILVDGWREHKDDALMLIFKHPKACFYFLLKQMQLWLFGTFGSLEGVYKEMLGFIPVRMGFMLNGAAYYFSLENLSSSYVGLNLNRIILHNQYDLSPEIVKGKICIDAGANMGVFSIFAAKLGAERVYAFEPVKETFQILEKNIRLNNVGHIVKPYNCALGSSQEKSLIEYSFPGDGMASLIINHTRSRGTVTSQQEVDVISIDHFLESRERKADIIKIDTEGFEENILLGAQDTIKRCSPRLMFSAYHKKEDKAVLPSVVQKINSDYHCILLDRDEEVFLFEPKKDYPQKEAD